MKKIVLCATAVLLLLANAAFAAENTGFYLGVSGGYVIPQTMTISDPDNGAAFLDAKLENGYLAGVTAGWLTPFTNRILAMELEYNYIFGTDFDNGEIVPEFWAGPATLDGTIKIHALLANFKARYPQGRFHPYAGFGVGYAYVKVGDITATSAEGYGTMRILGASGDAFCWQLMAGLDFDITPNLGVGIGYKYFVTKPTIGSEGDGIYSEADYKASIVTLGLTYTF